MSYYFDRKLDKRLNLGTRYEAEAKQLIEAKNIAKRQPTLNLQIAKAYIAGSDNGVKTRTWREAMEALTNNKPRAKKECWQRVAKDRALALLRDMVFIETQGEQLLKILQSGAVSTKDYRHRLHNFCLDMNWLPWPLIPKRQWPAVRFGDNRAITAEENRQIVEREKNTERRAFYQFEWHLDASQSDLARLQADVVDWQTRITCYERINLNGRGQPAQIRSGKEIEEILKDLPSTGPLFPYLATVRTGDRATEFKQRSA